MLPAPGTALRGREPGRHPGSCLLRRASAALCGRAASSAQVVLVSPSVKYAAEVAPPVPAFASEEAQDALVLGEFCWELVGLGEGETGVSDSPRWGGFRGSKEGEPLLL